MRSQRFVNLMALILALALPSFVAAEGDADKAGSVGFKFLNLAYGARGAALGGLAAQASGAEAIFWNPAGIALADGIGFSAGMTQWLVETSYLNAGVVLPLAGGVLGASILSVDYGEILKSGWSGETEFIFEANQGSFSAADVALQLSYARLLSDKFSIGGTAKIVTETIDTETLSGFAFDVGMQFRTGFRGIRLGAVISNFGPDIDPVSRPAGSSYTEFPSMSLPMTFSFGIIGQAYGDAAMGLVAGVNVVKYADLAQRFAFNGEFTIAGMAKLRASLTMDPSSTEGLASSVQGPLSLGAGINLAGIAADLAITTMQDFDAVTRFSIGYHF